MPIIFANAPDRSNVAPTMSSREIADLVTSRHDDVKRSIKRLADRGVIQLPPMADVKNHLGQTIQEYRVGKRDSYIIVAQLSPEFTARLVDRWQELEAAAAAPALPDFSNPAIAARAWADQFEQRTAAEKQVAELSPKASAYDAFINADGLFGYQNAGRALGCRPRMFTEWLKDKFCFYQGGVLLPRAEYVTAGYFEIKGELGTDDVTRPRGWVTPRGLDYLAKRIPPEILSRPPGPLLISAPTQGSIA